jgi:hypothetical protein
MMDNVQEKVYHFTLFVFRIHLNIILRRISGSHGGEYEYGCLLSCSDV